MTKEEIDQYYIDLANALEALFFDIVDEGEPSQHRDLISGKSLDEFNQSHGVIWDNHELALISGGFMDPPDEPPPPRYLEAEFDALKVSVGVASGIASLDTSGKVKEQALSVLDHLEAVPLSGIYTDGVAAAWVYNHNISPDKHMDELLTTQGDTIIRNTSGPARLAKGHTFQRLLMGSSVPEWGDETLGINFTIDGGGSAIGVGQKRYVETPHAGTLKAWTLLADQSGAIQIDIWKNTYANFPPTDADSICSGREPAIVSSALKGQSTDLANWANTAIDVGDVLAFNADACSLITRVSLSLKLTKKG